MKWTELAELIPLAGSGYDWTALCEAIPALVRLEETPQDPVFHAEGNVGIHTRMVLDCMLQDEHWIEASRLRQQVMFIAALLHDIAKPDTTVVDEATGRISQPGHSRRGSVDARGLLWQAQAPFELREAACRIIAVHQVPFFAMSSRTGKPAEFIVRRLSWELIVEDLVCVARADTNGRVSDQHDEHKDAVSLFEELASEEGCLSKQFATADAHTRLRYARGAQIDPRYAIYRDEGSEVVVLSGLPASGKDTWVRTHGNGRSVVSFDDARAELGLKHGKNDGMAAHAAVDKARELLRRKEPFIWNATHLSTQMRDKTLDVLYGYNARVEIVYLEEPEVTLFARNSSRSTTLRNKDLQRMLHRWEVPLPWEAHQVHYRA